MDSIEFDSALGVEQIRSRMRVRGVKRMGELHTKNKQTHMFDSNSIEEVTWINMADDGRDEDDKRKGYECDRGTTDPSGEFIVRASCQPHSLAYPSWSMQRHWQLHPS